MLHTLQSSRGINGNQFASIITAIIVSKMKKVNHKKKLFINSAARLKSESSFNSISSDQLSIHLWFMWGYVKFRTYLVMQESFYHNNKLILIKG